MDEAGKERKSVTKKQKLFCEEYLVDMNATHAAIRAGYSPKSASDIGSENMKNPEIEAEITRLMAERSKRTGVTSDRVLEELSKIAFCNPADVINLQNGTLLDENEIKKAAAIASVKVKQIPTRDGEIITEREIRMADKIKALELCGKHIGLFKEKVELGGNEGTIKVELGGVLNDWAK